MWCTEDLDNFIICKSLWNIFISQNTSTQACNRLTKNYGGDFAGHREFSWWHSSKHTANYEKQLNKTWHSEVHGVEKLVYMAYIGLYKFILYFLAMYSKL